MMIDWISVRIPCDLPHPISGGMIIDHDADGVIRYQIVKRLEVEGSYSSKIQVRAVALDELEISGNPAKFLVGHNVWGTPDIRGLIAALCKKILPPIFGEVPPMVLGNAILSRVDVTDGVLLDREGDVLAYLRAIEQTCRISYKGRGVLDGSTLMFGRSNKGQRAKDWQMVLYAKGLEVAKRGLPGDMGKEPRVIDYVNRLLRIEVRLRSRELDRLGLKRLGDWEADTAASVWQEKFDKLELSEVRQVETEVLEVMKPRIRMAYAAWRHGEDLRKGMSKTAFYKLRSDMRSALGVDIAVPVPKSNVVPLVRIIEAQRVGRPWFADEIDAILAA